MEAKQSNDVVHYKYAVGILLLIIISLLSFNYAPDTQLFNYVSFAATISSLILAVLAIIQGFLSSNSLSETVNNMNRSSKEIFDNAEKLSKIILGLDSKLTELPGMIKGLEDKITAPNELPNPAPPAQKQTAINITKPQIEYFKTKASVSNVTAVYMLLLSFKSGKKIVLNEFKDLFVDSSIEYIWYHCHLSCDWHGNHQCSFKSAYRNSGFIHFGAFRILG